MLLYLQRFITREAVADRKEASTKSQILKNLAINIGVFVKGIIKIRRCKR